MSAALAIGGAALLIAAGLWKRRFAAGAAELLARYGAERPEDILGRASAYREACVVAAEAAKKREAVEQALAGHIARDEETRRRLLELVHPFAPTVTDTFGVSAALSRALNLDERLSTARVKLEGARTLADSLPRPEEVSGGTDVEPRFDPAETAARLSAAEGELSRLRSGLAMAQGELNTLGDREALQTRREAIQEELDRRRAEYDALGAALAALEQAHSGLQARFSPALNRRAGELLAELTGGKYDKVALTQQFEALAEEHDGLQPRRALTLSQGTADQLYLAVRLAVCELVLPAEEPCPLVLDDALANFDDGRCALALEALARVGLANRIKHRPVEMSGGQQQRVAIARAIATKPPIIMADEPTGALDSHTGQEVLKFLQELNKEGSTVILITHDNGIAATARRVVRLADGRIIEDREQEVDWL